MQRTKIICNWNMKNFFKKIMHLATVEEGFKLCSCRKHLYKGKGTA